MNRSALLLETDAFQVPGMNVGLNLPQIGDFHLVQSLDSLC